MIAGACGFVVYSHETNVDNLDNLSAQTLPDEHVLSIDASDQCPQSYLERTVAICLKKLSSWPVPSNWSSLDWSEELTQIAWVAAMEAMEDFQPSKGVPLAAFIYQRIRARALTWVRREWSFAFRFQSEATPRVRLEENSSGGPKSLERGFSEGLSSCEAVRDALEDLAPAQKEIVQSLYWHGLTENEVSSELGIGRRAVNKRKHAALESLRNHPSVAAMRESVLGRHPKKI